MENIEKYISVKCHAYKCAKFFDELSMKEKLGFIENCIPYEQNSEFYKIFITTLLIPNDMYLLTQLITTKNITEISKYYQLPSKVIIAKIYEIKKYGLDDLLLSQKIDRDLASKKIVGLKLTDEISETLSLFFKDDSYTIRETEDNQRFKNRITKYI